MFSASPRFKIDFAPAQVATCTIASHRRGLAGATFRRCAVTTLPPTDEEADFAERMIALFRAWRSRMKNRDQSSVNSIYPDDPGHGVTPEQFARLFPAERLKKIETALKLPALGEGFRQSLISFFWVFYIDSLPRAKIKVSRKALKKELRRAAKLSRDLEESAARIWSSGERSVVTELGEFVEWQAWQSSRPMHRSGIGFVGALDEFATRTGRLADELPNDVGGYPPAKSFDDLTKGLAMYYRELSKNEPTTSANDPFFRLMTEVVDVLREVESKLPAAQFRLPTDEKALGMRLHRL